MAAADMSQVGHALTKVGFTDKTKEQKVAELSGGWRMRLAIAVAILENAELLMLVTLRAFCRLMCFVHS